MNAPFHIMLLSDRILAACSKITIVAGGLLIVLIALVGAADVITSNLFNYPLPAVNTLAEELLPASVLLSAGFVVRTRANIVVDILTEQLRGAFKRGLFAVSTVLVVLYFTILTWGAWALATESIELGEYAVAAIEFPVWPMKLAFAVGASIATLEAFRTAIVACYQLVCPNAGPNRHTHTDNTTQKGTE